MIYDLMLLELIYLLISNNSSHNLSQNYVNKNDKMTNNIKIRKVKKLIFFMINFRHTPRIYSGLPLDLGNINMKPGYGSSVTTHSFYEMFIEKFSQRPKITLSPHKDNIITHTRNLCSSNFKKNEIENTYRFY